MGVTELYRYNKVMGVTELYRYNKVMGVTELYRYNKVMGVTELYRYNKVMGVTEAIGHAHSRYLTVDLLMAINYHRVGRLNNTTFNQIPSLSICICEYHQYYEQLFFLYILL